MLSKLFGFFAGGSTSLYIGLAVMLLIATLSGGTYYYHKQFTQQVTANAVLQSENDGLVLKIKQDSDAIAKLAADAATREAAAKVALAAANAKVKYYSKKAQDYLLAQAQSPANLCLSADLLYNDYITGAK
jgi:Tfp pilus assembly protein PilN